MQKSTIAILFILLTMSLSGCASGKHIIELTPENRLNISALVIEVDHDVSPGIHQLVNSSFSLREGKLVKTLTRVGPTSSWPNEKYKEEMKKHQGKVKGALETHFPDNTLAKTLIPALFVKTTKPSDRIKVVNDSEKHNSTLTFHVYHKACFGGFITATPETYAGVRVKIKTLFKKTIYERLLFSDRWTATDDFIKQGIKPAMEEFLGHVVKVVRKDLQGS